MQNINTETGIHHSCVKANELSESIVRILKSGTGNQATLEGFKITSMWMEGSLYFLVTQGPLTAKLPESFVPNAGDLTFENLLISRENTSGVTAYTLPVDWFCKYQDREDEIKKEKQLKTITQIINSDDNKFLLKGNSFYKISISLDENYDPTENAECYKDEESIRLINNGLLTFYMVTVEKYKLNNPFENMAILVSSNKSESLGGVESYDDSDESRQDSEKHMANIILDLIKQIES